MTELISTGTGTAFVAEVAFKAVAALGITWALVRLLRRASAATRYATWVVGLSVVVAIPIGAVVLPDLSLPLLVGPASSAPAPAAAAEVAYPSSELMAVAAANAAAWREGADAPMSRLGHEPEAAIPAPDRRVGSVVAWLFVIWWVGALVALARLAVDWIRAGLLTRQGAVAAPAREQRVADWLARQLGVRRSVRVLRSSWLSVPVNYGILRPVVVLPAGADRWTAERLRVVLLHELAHIRRWDSLTHLVAEIACALHWANPFVWLAAKRAHHEQEQACDDTVIRVGTGSTDYAQHLLEIAQDAGPRGPSLRTALAMASPAALVTRVRAILDPANNRAPTAQGTVLAAAVVAVGLAAPLTSLNVIGASRQVRAVRVVALGLSAPDAAVRVASAWRLGSFRSGEAVLALTRSLNDPVPDVRGAAALALGAVGEPDAIPGLLAALDDADPYVRENVLLALYKFDDPRARDAVFGAMHDPEHGVRSVLSYALGEIKGDRAARALIEVIRFDPDDHARSMALWAFMETGSDIVPPFFVTALRDSSSGMRGTAAAALGRLAYAPAIDELVRVLTNDADPAVRLLAGQALEAMPDVRAVPGLLRALDDSERRVREAAVRALAKIDDPRATDGVIRALRDPVHQVRMTAQWALEDADARQ
ncbi:MAG TPA: M56 family metallopeptidase [Gemmatimonadales bacterium]